MEVLDPAEAAIREEGKQIVELFRSGDELGALQRAQVLANAHPDSPVAIVLRADLLREHVRDKDMPGFHAREVDKAGLRNRANQDAEIDYRNAAQMVPSCIDIGVSLGEVLSDLQKCEMAEAEFSRALEMKDPIDPAENILAYGVRRPVRSTARTRIRDVRERGMVAREKNREALNNDIRCKTEEVMALQKSNVALKRAAGIASLYSFSVRAHLLHAHMGMELAYSLPDRVRRVALRRALTTLDNAESEKKCDFQKSLVVSLFRAKMLYLLREYAAAEQECRRALMIADADDPAQQDIVPGSVPGRDRYERTNSCRAQLFWLLVKELVTVSVHFYRSLPDQHERYLSFTFASLKQQYHGSDCGVVNMLLSAEKQFDLHHTILAYICPDCKRRNFSTPAELLEHVTGAHAAHLPQAAKDLVKALEEDASDQEQVACDADSMTIRFPDIFSLVESVTEVPLGISFADILQKKRCKAAMIYKKILQELCALPLECSSIQLENVSSEVRKLWTNLKEVSKMDLLLPFARLSLWRDILKHMSIEAHNSDWAVTTSDMERLFNVQNELHIVDIEENTTNPDDGASDDNELEQDQTGNKISDTSVKEEESNTNVKGHRRKDPILEKKLSFIQDYVNGSSKEDYNLFMILQFLYSIRTPRNELLRGSVESEQKCQLRDTIHEFFIEWKKQEYDRISEFVSSFKEVLVQVCNDRTTFPQVRQVYASEAVATVLKKLYVSIPSTLGIKMLFKTSCCCGSSSDTESVTLVLKYHTVCNNNTQISSFTDLQMLYEEPRECLECGNLKDIDVTITQMPQCLQIGLDWSTGSSPCTLSDLMANLNSPREISFFCRGIQSDMKYKLTSMICWSKGLYIFFGREKKRWLVFDETKAKTQTWSQVLELYRSGNLQPDILYFESVQSGLTLSVPPDISHPQEDTSHAIIATPQQHFRPAKDKQTQIIDEDVDEEKQLHLNFKAKMDACPSGSVPCLICYQKKRGKATPMDVTDLPGHCKTFHPGSIKCSKQGCPVRASNRGDIGKHEMYCHG